MNKRASEWTCMRQYGISINESLSCTVSWSLFHSINRPITHCDIGIVRLYTMNVRSNNITTSKKITQSLTLHVNPFILSFINNFILSIWYWPWISKVVYHIVVIIQDELQRSKGKSNNMNTLQALAEIIFMILILHIFKITHWCTRPRRKKDKNKE